MDALEMLKESSAQELGKAAEPDEASIARKNEQSMQELQQMLQGAR